MIDTSEKSFEAHIETVLTASGYRAREPKNYNAESCMDEELLFELYVLFDSINLFRIL